MKKLLTSIFVLALCAVPASSQLLYKVTKPGTNKTSYILGTHHFAPVSILDNIKGLDAALQQVDALYGEYDMSTMQTQEASDAMTAAMMAPEGGQLPDLLPAARLDSLKTVWNSLTGGALALDNFYPLKPAAISTQIAAMLAMQNIKDFNPLQGVDETMQNRARSLGKPVGGLETMQDQLDLLYGTSLNRQAEDLMEVVRNFDRERETVVKLTNAYMSRDMNAIERLVTDPTLNSNDELDRLIYNRNKRWAAQLLNAMPEKNVIAVVGAGHLPGDLGLLNILRISGYDVSAVD